jgi:hypothetical protein
MSTRGVQTDCGPIGWGGAHRGGSTVRPLIPLCITSRDFPTSLSLTSNLLTSWLFSTPSFKSLPLLNAPCVRSLSIFSSPAASPRVPDRLACPIPFSASCVLSSPRSFLPVIAVVCFFVAKQDRAVTSLAVESPASELLQLLSIALWTPEFGLGPSGSPPWCLSSKAVSWGDSPFAVPRVAGRSVVDDGLLEAEGGRVGREGGAVVIVGGHGEWGGRPRARA